MKSICIVNYGLGNIASLYNSLSKIGNTPDFFTDNIKKNYDIIFIPGIGSFYKGSKLIHKEKILQFINRHVNNNSFVFGICLGMQLLLSSGTENGKSDGLNIFKGNVKRLSSKKNIILPVTGWQTVKFKKNFINLKRKYNNEKFYFIHSYVAHVTQSKNVLTESTYDKIKYNSALQKENILGTQFHPEKSGEVGLNFLKDIIRYT